jgi:GTP-binding protein of the ras superfamily involved in termination of M-phase
LAINLTNTGGHRAGLSSPRKRPVHLKIGLLGDRGVGKTSLMVSYVSEDMSTEAVFMEKKITIKGNEVNLSIWDVPAAELSPDHQMIPVVCADAMALFFMFDLTNMSSLLSVKEWYRTARSFNKATVPFLVGNKYDLFASLPEEEKEKVITKARKFAKAMKAAALVFISVETKLNVQKLFVVALAKLFNLRCTVGLLQRVCDPIIEYDRPFITPKTLVDLCIRCIKANLGDSTTPGSDNDRRTSRLPTGLLSKQSSPKLTLTPQLLERLPSEIKLKLGLE